MQSDKDILVNETIKLRKELIKYRESVIHNQSLMPLCFSKMYRLQELHNKIFDLGYYDILCQEWEKTKEIDIIYNRLYDALSYYNNNYDALSYCNNYYTSPYLYFYLVDEFGRYDYGTGYEYILNSGILTDNSFTLYDNFDMEKDDILIRMHLGNGFIIKTWSFNIKDVIDIRIERTAPNMSILVYFPSNFVESSKIQESNTHFVLGNRRDEDSEQTFK